MINKKKIENYIKKILQNEYKENWEKIYNESALSQLP